MNRKRLLIVDDEKLVHDVIGRALRRRIDIVHELSAEEALEHLAIELEGGAFDVVLLDVCMPGVPDGIDFFRYIQRIDAGRRPPVIFMTGDDRIASTLGGTMKTRCLAKPFSIGELREALGAFLTPVSDVPCAS
ncbi:MAG: response regulator [Labilithrix sp.]|nr:response regulator [Labilithrix sp.]MCW5813756.1 response regulator [Labilithrix sp.]